MSSIICLLVILYVFFGKMSLQVLWPFFFSVICFFDIQLYDLFIYFGFKPLAVIVICEYYVSFSKFSLHFINGFLSCTKLLSLIRPNLFNFCFVSFCLVRLIQKNIAMIYVRVFSLCSLLGFLGFQVLHLDL